MSNVKAKAWGYIAACAVFALSIFLPFLRVEVDFDITDPYIRVVRVGSHLIGLAIVLLAVWGIYIALKGQKKLAVIPSISAFALAVIAMVSLTMSSKDFDGIFLVLGDESYYITDICTGMHAHIAPGLFVTIIASIAMVVMGFFLYSAEEEY